MHPFAPPLPRVLRLAPATALLLAFALGCQGEGEKASPEIEVAADPADSTPPGGDMPATPPDWPLSCDIEVPKTVREGEKIELVFTLHHRGDLPLWVLPWQTPIEGLVSSPFSILKGERPAPFNGRMIKRAPPRLEDYREIPPHSSQSYKVDLASAYDLQGPGLYTVTFDSMLFDVAGDRAGLPRSFDLLQGFELDCPIVQFEILAASAGS